MEKSLYRVKILYRTPDGLCRFLGYPDIDLTICSPGIII